jgi:hypothetical protein
MKLTNSSHSAFELQIIDYQFPKDTVDWNDAQWQHIVRELGRANLPDSVVDWYDLNWLRVRINAAIEGRAWAVTSACLLTSEITRLAN